MWTAPNPGIAAFTSVGEADHKLLHFDKFAKLFHLNSVRFFAELQAFSTVGQHMFGQLPCCNQ